MPVRIYIIVQDEKMEQDILFEKMERNLLERMSHMQKSIDDLAKSLEDIKGRKLWGQFQWHEAGNRTLLASAL